MVVVIVLCVAEAVLWVRCERGCGVRVWCARGLDEPSRAVVVCEAREAL